MAKLSRSRSLLRRSLGGEERSIETQFASLSSRFNAHSERFRVVAVLVSIVLFLVAALALNAIGTAVGRKTLVWIGLAILGAVVFVTFRRHKQRGLAKSIENAADQQQQRQQQPRDTATVAQVEEAVESLVAQASLDGCLKQKVKRTVTGHDEEIRVNVGPPPQAANAVSSPRGAAVSVGAGAARSGTSEIAEAIIGSDADAMIGDAIDEIVSDLGLLPAEKLVSAEKPQAAADDGDQESGLNDATFLLDSNSDLIDAVADEEGVDQSRGAIRNV